MKIYVLQRKLPFEEGFHFISAHQNISSAQKKVKQFYSFKEEPNWYYAGFRWCIRTEEWDTSMGENLPTYWQVFETEVEDYIPAQPEPLEFSPVPDLE